MSRRGVYDLEQEPDPDWPSLDESERRERVRLAHEHASAPVGESEELHTIIHVIIENRLADEGDALVRAAYDRLRAAGLDRHTTIHALGSVVSNQISAALQSPDDVDPEMLDRGFAEIDPAQWRPTPPRNQHVARPALGRRPKRAKKR